mgnify:CR=1 FL=1|jgi:hypothetical protein
MLSRTVTGEFDGQQVSGQSPSGRAQRRSTERRRNLSIREAIGNRLCENNPNIWSVWIGTVKRGGDRSSSTPQNHSRWNRRLLCVGYFLLDLRQKLQCLDEQGTCFGPLRVLEKTACCFAAGGVDRIHRSEWTDVREKTRLAVRGSDV